MKPLLALVFAVIACIAGGVSFDMNFQGLGASLWMVSTILLIATIVEYDLKP